MSKYLELVKTIEVNVNPHKIGLQDSFRIEIFSDGTGFFPIVYRRECYSVQQGCGSQDSEYWDAHVLAIDISRDWSLDRADSVEALIEQTLKNLQDTVGYQDFADEGE